MKPNNRAIEFIMNILKDRKRAVAIILVYLICLLTLLPVTSNALIFDDDSRDDPVCFSEALQFYSRSVATFKIGWGRCGVDATCGTAFLISPTNLILTTAHSAPDLAPGGWITGELVFDQQAETCGGGLATPHVVKYSVPYEDIVINRDLDYMLFQPLNQSTGEVIDVAITQGTHRWLKLDPDTRLTELPDHQKGLYIIGYNDVHDKLMVAMDQACRIKEAKETCEQLEKLGYDPPDDACLTHRCDVNESQSGSPTIRYNQYSSNLGVISMVSGSEGGLDIVLDNLDVKIRRIYQDIQERTDGILTGIYDDTDRDGMPDCRDNCPDVPNTGTCTEGKVGVINCLGDEDCDTSPYSIDGKCEGSQLDTNGDGLGDACSVLDQDDYEPNDTPLQAVELTQGRYDLTIHDRYDTDFYLITVPTRTDYFRIGATYTTRNRELARWMRYKDCNTCPTALALGVFKDVTSGWTYVERGDIPATRTYEIELYEWEERGPLSYELSIIFGGEALPPDHKEPNDAISTATEASGCDFTGQINIHNASDVDYYKIDAAGYSVQAEISFDPTQGELELFLEDAAGNPLEGQTTETTLSEDGFKKTLRITACGKSESFVKVQGDPNFYDYCIRRVPLKESCPGYFTPDVLKGRGTLTYTDMDCDPSKPPAEQTSNVKERMRAAITSESPGEVFWTVGAEFEDLGYIIAVELHCERGIQPSPAQVTIKLLNPYSGDIWWQGSGTGECYGPDSPDVITGFSAAADLTSIVPFYCNAPGHGTLTIEGYADTDNDGIPDEVEIATGTDPNSDDTDGDGLADGTEDANHNGKVDYLQEETDPRLWDSDGDGVSDGVEKGLTSPEGNDTDPSSFQADLDAATTTDPNRKDTDRDGRSDGEEDANGNGRVDPGETSPIVPDEALPTIWNISGGAYNYPEGGRYRASFSMDITTGDPSPSGWLKYYYIRTRMNFVSTGFTEASVSGNTAAISGTGTVNDVDGYTFTASVSDGDPDNFGITISNSDGSTYYTAGSGAISGGDFAIISQ